LIIGGLAFGDGRGYLALTLPKRSDNNNDQIKSGASISCRISKSFCSMRILKQPKLLEAELQPRSTNHHELRTNKQPTIQPTIKILQFFVNLHHLRSASAPLRPVPSHPRRCLRTPKPGLNDPDGSNNDVALLRASYYPKCQILFHRRQW